MFMRAVGQANSAFSMIFLLDFQIGRRKSRQAIEKQWFLFSPMLAEKVKGLGTENILPVPKVLGFFAEKR
jgi:hypothetical protein